MIHISDLKLGPDERAALQRVIDREWFNEGPEVHAFEEEFADFLNVKYVVAVSSGTAALMCGLTAMKIDPRWDITDALVPALTFISTANAASLCGLGVDFIDVSLENFCMDPTYLPWYKGHSVVIPVHLFGFPAPIREIWAKARIPLVEDACEAHGTLVGDKIAGSIGLWSATSFHMAHTMQAGEFGAFCTNDVELARTVRRLKAHGRECACKTCTRNSSGCPIMQNEGRDPRFRFLYPGFNFKPMEFPAALARVQLTKIYDNIGRRLDNSYYLSERLSDLKELRVPNFPDTAVPMVYPLILTREGVRDQVTMGLTKRGIETRPLFGSIPTQQPAYAGTSKRQFPVADYLGANGFYVGCHQYLERCDLDAIVEGIVDTVKEICRG
jgi:CDP-6-deoxy-D-xylo-4-hexulose-3-dehydrase